MSFFVHEEKEIAKIISSEARARNRFFVFITLIFVLELGVQIPEQSIDLS
jgi:hypothetical protein